MLNEEKYQNLKSKRFSAQRSRSEEKTRKRTKKRNRGASTPLKPRRPRKPIKVIAPAQFSLTKNPDKTIEFFSELRSSFARASKDQGVFIDLNSVSEMTPEVIVVLISRIKKKELVNEKPLHGNVPRNDVARDMLVSSGFYNFVHSRTPVAKPSYGVIEKCGDRVVDAEKAARLIDNVAESLEMSLEQEDGHQTTAVECMTNTREHASGHQSNHKRKKKWWFSVYCNPENGVAQFAFVDLGIGIIESLERQKFPWLADLMDRSVSETRSDVLRELLADQTAGSNLSTRKRTSTGEQYRGKGLPNIARRNREKQTRQLRIVSNNVFADVENSNYHMLEQEFSGTIICWEHWTKDDE